MEHTVTCRTDGCGNCGVGVVVTDPATVVQCGACFEFITDIVPPVPEETAPEPEGVMFQGVRMQPFATESGQIDVDPGRQVVVFADQVDVHPQIDTTAGTVTFARMDGLTPELVTGWVGVRS